MLPFDRHLDSAERAIEIINTVSDAGSSPELGAALRELLEGWGEADAESLIEELDEFVAVCHELRRLCAIVDRDQAAHELNRLLAVHSAPPRLEREAGWDWHLHFDEPGTGWTRWFAATSTFALAARFASSDRVPWGICADPTCGLAFLDRGRRQAQQYCSTRCATRVRVRRHRASVGTGGAVADRTPSRVGRG